VLQSHALAGGQLHVGRQPQRQLATTALDREDTGTGAGALAYGQLAAADHAVYRCPQAGLRQCPFGLAALGAGGGQRRGGGVEFGLDGFHLARADGLALLRGLDAGVALMHLLPAYAGGGFVTAGSQQLRAQRRGVQLGQQLASAYAIADVGVQADDAAGHGKCQFGSRNRAHFGNVGLALLGHAAGSNDQRRARGWRGLLAGGVVAGSQAQ